MADSWSALDANERGSLTAVSVVDNKTIVRLTADPATGALLVSVSGGFSAFTLVATGAVNGVNTAFTFIQEPTYVVSDGVWYPRLDNNGVAQWTWTAGTLTVTMVIPPNSIIFGIA